MIAIVAGEHPAHGIHGGNARVIGMSGFGASTALTGCGRGGPEDGYLSTTVPADATTTPTMTTIFPARAESMSMEDTATATRCSWIEPIRHTTEFLAEMASKGRFLKLSREPWHREELNIACEKRLQNGLPENIARLYREEAPRRRSRPLLHLIEAEHHR